MFLAATATTLTPIRHFPPSLPSHAAAASGLGLKNSCLRSGASPTGTSDGLLLTNELRPRSRQPRLER